MKRLSGLYPFSYSRLKKIALGGNIQESDVDYVYNNNGQIRLVLLNEEKALHDMSQDWSGEYFNSKDSGDVIGFIQYNEDEEDGKYRIYVAFLEMREEYRQTRAVKYLFNEFKTNLLDKAIKNYGKENVYLSASVVNEDLEAFLSRWSEKNGINFNSGELDFTSLEDDDEDFSINDGDEINDQEMYDDLINAGAQINPGSGVSDLEVMNFSVEQYIELAEKNDFVVDTLYGRIDVESGNVIYSIYNSSFMGNNTLEYSILSDVAYLSGRLSDYNQTVADNIQKVLPPFCSVRINSQTFNLDRFVDEISKINNFTWDDFI